MIVDASGSKQENVQATKDFLEAFTTRYSFAESG